MALLGQGGIRIAMIAIGIPCLLEAGQLLLPTRYASVSDVIIEGLGTTLGYIMLSGFDSAAHDMHASR
jgi:VanZ family protein